jgi:hypothetical protein
MRDWLVYIVLYVVGLGLFRLLGNFGAAGNALRSWGEASSKLRADPSSSS